MMRSLPFPDQRPRFSPGFWAPAFIPPHTPLYAFTHLSSHAHLRLTSPGTKLNHQNAAASVLATLSRRTRKKKKKMLLGKRPRPPMKRTTSMSEITLDLNVSPDAPPLDPDNPPNPNPNPNPNWHRPADAPRKQPPGSNSSDQKVSPSNHRRHSDFIQTSDFLRACSLCKRRLVLGRDIYMYRGDSAFCSLECRQKQMIQDERKEKRCLASNKQKVAPSSGSQVTSKGESVAAL